jgi:hypothetical protein
MENEALEGRVEEIERLLANRHFKQAVIESGSVLEGMLRTLYQKAFPKLTPSEQKKISEAVEAIGKDKSVDQYSLGQLVGLFRNTKLFREAEKKLGLSLKHLARTDFDTLVEIRNKATHGGETVAEDEAKLLFSQLRVFAREVGLLKETPEPAAVQASTQLRPWTEVVKLHPDVEEGNLTEAVFAIDLGAVAANDPNVPVVNRDPEAFFRATYLTADLRRMLEEVLSSLAGKPGYNRVLKLRTPFGGGKSHTLAALLHAVRSRPALKASAEHWARVHPYVAEGREKYGQGKVIKFDELSDPGEVAVAVFDGEKFDARDGKEVELDGGPKKIQTMWGWIAWQIDPRKAFPIVAEHDRDRVAPGGDLVKELLTKGAGGRPVLILLDEVLKYMEGAGAVAIHDSTLQRQAKGFLQTLTVEVANSTNAVLVYSLTWSSREALGNVALLEEIDHLAGRVDQLREPVSGDEILPVLQRRLLGEPPDPSLATEVAIAYQEVVTGMRRAHAETKTDRQQAEEEGIILRDRIRGGYPFHPALIDVMKERWCSLDAFQRTRGALRFLASCLHSLKKRGGARALVGPGEVPIGDVDVRMRMLKELGAQNEFDPVILADIEGPNARAKRIDERLAKETPAMANIKPATRLATAILVYSFGGLRREAGDQTETLPPGVTEPELLSACVGPDLENMTARAVLKDLREACIFLHYDGVHYCFKKDPNVTKLIEDAEQEVARHPEEIRARIREMLDERLSAHHASVIVWPEKSQDIPDQEPVFLTGYMPLEFARKSRAEQESQAKEFLTRYGEKPRRYRNGLGLAIPNKTEIESLRRAVRYLLAIGRVEDKKGQHRLTKDQLEQLKERRKTEEAAAESALRSLYSSVWLPRVEKGEIEIEKVEKGGRPLQATGVHERVMELLTAIPPKRVFGSVKPTKIKERVKLGELGVEGRPPVLGIKVSDVRDAFFEILEPPRLESDEVLTKGIAQGVAESQFAYFSGAAPSVGTDGTFQVSRERVIIGRTLPDDEIDVDSGFLMMPSAVPEAPAVVTPVDTGGGEVPPKESGGEEGGEEIEPATQKRKVVRLNFTASRAQVYRAFPAIANLADKSDDGKVKVHVEGTSAEGYDASWLRNAVEEPLDEADIERQ